MEDRKLPELGLVCITASQDVRYRTITRTRMLSLPDETKRTTLDALYRDNLQTLFKAIHYCREHGIGLYRVTSNLFPQVDHPIGAQVFEGLAPSMRLFGPYAERMGVRVVIHPDQYVVINSATPAVVKQSLEILAQHALTFDRLGLPRSHWAAMTLHGGKSGRRNELIATIAELPDAVRSRLVLENDESAFDAEQILQICRVAKVPMVFDAHHHLVNRKLESYEDASIAHFTSAARETWPVPEWQLVHLSNGASALHDSRHSDTIDAFPSAFRRHIWLELEAKKKELAIGELRGRLGATG
jgi:UV DNA damage endonuclease